jgi:CheY-like chemotaxis protein
MSRLGSLRAILGSATADDRLADGPWSLHGSAPVRLLLVEDDEEDAILLKRTLAEIPDARFEVQRVATGEAALQALASGWYDATLVDYNLGGSSGVDLIRDATAAGCVTPLIMLTGQRDRTTDMVAMKAGAADFLVKGQTDATLLDRTLRYAITSARIHEELRRGREQILGLEQIGRLLSEDWPIDDAIEQLLRVMEDAFEYQYVAIYLRSAQGFDVRRASGYKHPITRVDASDTMLDRIVALRQPTLVANFTRSPDHREADTHIRQEMCLPVVVDGRTIGLLSVGSPDGEELGERDVVILRAVAGRLASALALSLERDLLAVRGRRSGRVTAMARELGAAVHVADDATFWGMLAESAGGALSSEIVVLEIVEDGPDGPGWRQLARSQGDGSAADDGAMRAVADAAVADGHSLDVPRKLAAIRLDGWRHPVVLVNVGGALQTPTEMLQQLALAVEPILRLRVAISANVHLGQERLSAFAIAVDWAIAGAGTSQPSAPFAVLVLESLEDGAGATTLASDMQTESRVLVAELGPRRLGLVLEIDADDRTAAAAVHLASAMAGTRSVVGGISIIGPDLAAAAFERASGALELARRLGPGNTVVA